MITKSIAIMDIIGARLANITIANGYSLDLIPATILRSRIREFTGNDVPIAFYWADVDVRREDTTDNQLRTIGGGIALYNRTYDDSFVNQSLLLGNDVYTALHRDTLAPKVIDEPSIDLGEFVDNFLIDEILPIVAVGQTPFCGVLMTYEIQYSFKQGTQYINDV